MSLSPQSLLQQLSFSRPFHNPVVPPEFDNAVRSSLLNTGKKRLRYFYAKLAEQVLCDALPVFAREISAVGSRKGSSGSVGKRIAGQIGTHAAAALAALWWLRSARHAGIREVLQVAGQRHGFGSALNRFLGAAEVSRMMSAIGWRTSLAR